MNKAITCI